MDDDDDAPYFPSLPSIMQLRRSDHALIPDDRVITAESEQRVRADGDAWRFCTALPERIDAPSVQTKSVREISDKL